jgi:hypothetical protein
MSSGCGTQPAVSSALAAMARLAERSGKHTLPGMAPGSDQDGAGRCSRLRYLERDGPAAPRRC